MNLSKNFYSLPALPFTVLITVFMLINIQLSFSQPFSDSVSIKSTVKLSSKKRVETIKECNVVFPAILKGNEDESMDYIEKFSSKRKSYLVRMHAKGKQFFPKTIKIFGKYNIPEELRILLPLESAFNGNAISKAGAVGYWQLMDEVAREYGLKCAIKETVRTGKRSFKQKRIAKKRQKDERMDFAKSTLTAARYLHARKLNFDEDWLLVVASYNYGVGNVWNAMKKSGKKKPSFWDIKKYLPAETKSYVMNFITMNVIFNNYDNFIRNKLVFNTSKKITTQEDEEEMNL